jgi:hypothetical protein
MNRIDAPMITAATTPPIISVFVVLRNDEVLDCVELVDAVPEFELTLVVDD